MQKLPLAASAAVLATACSTSAQQARRPAPGDVIATVGSTAITMAEVDDKALEQPAQGGVKLSLALYDARRAALDDLIANRLIDDAARAQGMDRSALIEKEITTKVQTVTDADVNTGYEANKARVQGAPVEQVGQ